MLTSFSPMYLFYVGTTRIKRHPMEEFRHLATYPHHHHDAQGHVHPSPLKGDPLQDIEIVLQEVTAFLEQ